MEYNEASKVNKFLQGEDWFLLTLEATYQMKPLSERQETFKTEVFAHHPAFPEPLLVEFYEYWSEPDRAPKQKMRFEKEKTWDLTRRLHRWARINYSNHKIPLQPMKNKSQPKPLSEIEQLDAALNAYKKHPALVNVRELEKWYNVLYKNNLMKSFTKAEVEVIKDLYMPDLGMCRAACVERTFTMCANLLTTFAEIKKRKEKDGAHKTNG